MELRFFVLMIYESQGWGIVSKSNKRVYKNSSIFFRDYINENCEGYSHGFLFMCILTSIIMEQSASNRKIAVVFSELLM
jgi:hypothetical protein